MASVNFSEIEIDAIGEIMNISLGASATAISTMLDARVDITTPSVRVVTKTDFNFSNLQPAVGVEITYVSGLDGKNIMLLKRNDVRVIVELLMGMEIPDEDFQLDEMNISAICEVMNQMMGASSTALSEFLGDVVNISTPRSFEIANEEEFKDIYFENEEQKVVVGFTLTIDDRLHSEFVNMMSVDLVKELLKGFLPEEDTAPDSVEPVPQAPAAEAAPPMPSMPFETPMQPAMAGGTPMQAAPPMMDGAQVMQQPMMGGGAAMPMQPQMMGGGAAMPMQQPMMASDAFMSQQMMMQQMMQQMQQQMQQMQDQMSRVREKKILNASPATHPELRGNIGSEEEQGENLELVMGVPLEVSVEIGRTHSLVRNILEYTKGTLVVLDKQAGDQVDLFVNGQCIAKGDVVVVDDNFGIRITEVLKRPDFF